MDAFPIDRWPSVDRELEIRRIDGASPSGICGPTRSWPSPRVEVDRLSITRIVRELRRFQRLPMASTPSSETEYARRLFQSPGWTTWHLEITDAPVRRCGRWSPLASLAERRPSIP